jgi:nitrogen fixation NifU-like protein
MPRYSSVVEDHFHRPRNVGPLEGLPAGTAGTPGEGPYVLIWVECAGGRVARAAYRTYGCPAAVASASMAVEWAMGKGEDEVMRLTPALLTELLGGLPEGKEHCPDLAVRALRAALEEARL